jgi:hypothetical protein
VSRTLREQDLLAGLTVTFGSILLGAPIGLLWAAVAPRAHVLVSARGTDIPDVETTKAFIGADGSYFLVLLGAGVLCGLLAWRFFRRSGPVVVLALAIGGIVAALIVAAVGLLPGAQEALDAVSEGSTFRGSTDLYLGRLVHKGAVSVHSLSLRATWAFVAWPVGALLTFLAAATIRPQDLD